VKIIVQTALEKKRKRIATLKKFVRSAGENGRSNDACTKFLMRVYDLNKRTAQDRIGDLVWCGRLKERKGKGRMLFWED